MGRIPVAALRHRDGHPDFEGDVEYAPMWAGESCGVVNDVKPAGEIVRDIVRDAEAALRGG